MWLEIKFESRRKIYDDDVQIGMYDEHEYIEIIMLEKYSRREIDKKIESEIKKIKKKIIKTMK
jgi:hypothetical protein